MSGLRYSVQFDAREAVTGDPAALRQRLGEVLKLDDALLASFFSGRAVTIKHGLEYRRAMTYRDALVKAGIPVRVVTGSAGAQPAIDQAVASIDTGVEGVGAVSCPRCGFEQRQSTSRCGRCQLPLRGAVVGRRG